VTVNTGDPLTTENDYCWSADVGAACRNVSGVVAKHGVARRSGDRSGIVVGFEIPRPSDGDVNKHRLVYGTTGVRRSDVFVNGCV